MRRKTFLSLALLAVLGLVLSVSCKKDEDPVEMSQATLAFTDAATDELSLFEVDVTSVIFHKYSGASVSVLTKTTRVDFASLESFSELIVGVGLEAGYYTGMTMTLDFSNATVLIEDKTAAAALLDGDGNPLTGTMEVNIEFPPSSRPQVGPGANHLFVLDLNLDQAIQVDDTLNEVTFEPIISVEVDPSNPKPILATGYLSSVDETAGSFVVEKRAEDGSVIGTFTIMVDAATVYQVNGTSHVGATGLAALAGLSTGTRVWMRGTVNAETIALDASVVEAGAGTFGAGQDWVEGLIVSRDVGAGGDATFGVLGTSKNVTTGTRTFNTVHTVTTTFNNTKVLRRGTTAALDTDDLSIGQRVFAFGAISGITLDATAVTGVVRMVRTSVSGWAQGPVSGGTLTINVARFGLRHVSNFNFTVGGTPEANAASYTIDVSGLSLPTVVNGSRVRAIGWVNPLGSTTHEFTAISAVDRGTDWRLMLCGWLTPTESAIASASATAVTLDVSAASWKVIDDGIDGTTTMTDTPAPQIQPKYGWGVYLIFENGGVQIHWSFEDFANSLNARISPTSKVSRIGALGSFDNGTQVFQASVVSVVLKP